MKRNASVGRSTVTPNDSLVENQADTPDDVVFDDNMQYVPISDTVENANQIVSEVQSPEEERDRMRLSPVEEAQLDQKISQRPKEDITIEWVEASDLPEGEKHKAGYQAVDERGNIVHKGMTLEQIEHIQGKAQEAERHVEKSFRDHEVREEGEMWPRAEACREEVEDDTYYQRTSKDEDELEIDTPPENPWEELTQDEIAKVNQSAERLADHFGTETSMGRATMSKLLAQRMAGGQGAMHATIDLRESLEQFPDVKQPIDNIDAFSQYQTTVEGEIDVLWDPRGDGQRQVGIISDETGSMKITIWHRAGDKPTLHEGDTVRINRGKVNAYQKGGEWQKSIAIDSKAEVHRLQHGDGDAPRQKRSSPDPTIPAYRADSDTHAWLIQANTDTKPREETDISDEKVKALNEWIRGNITESEVDEYAAKLKNE